MLVRIVARNLTQEIGNMEITEKPFTVEKRIGFNSAILEVTKEINKQYEEDLLSMDECDRLITAIVALKK